MTTDERLNVIVNHAFGGWHHVSGRKPIGRDSVTFTAGGDFSTFDWTNMTRLVLACHAVRVRAEVTNGGPHRLKITLSPRVNKPDSWSEHHPDLDDLIAQARDLKEAMQESDETEAGLHK